MLPAKGTRAEAGLEGDFLVRLEHCSYRVELYTAARPACDVCSTSGDTRMAGATQFVTQFPPLLFNAFAVLTDSYCNEDANKSSG